MTALIDRIKPLWASNQSNEPVTAPTLERTVRSAVQDDLADYNHLVMEYQDLIYNQAYRLLGDHQAAEDAAQEAFILAYFKFHTFNGGSLRAWLLRIVTNLCYDEMRRQKRSQTVPLEPLDGYGEEIESPIWLADPAETPEEAAERSELRDRIQKSLNKLPPDHRIVLVLVDLQGLDYAEAAAVIGCPMGTLKSRLARARSHLRAELRGPLQKIKYPYISNSTL